MAGPQLHLDVIVDDNGTLKLTSASMEKLGKSTEKTTRKTKNLTKEQNKLKRNLEGTAQRSGRAGKDFARMSQGMGGLVQAYATVAANVFALSSALAIFSGS